MSGSGSGGLVELLSVVWYWVKDVAVRRRIESESVLSQVPRGHSVGAGRAQVSGAKTRVIPCLTAWMQT